MNFCLIRSGTRWFNGFVLVHPGTEPRGHLEVVWHSTRAIPIHEDHIEETKKDIIALEPKAHFTVYDAEPR